MPAENIKRAIKRGTGELPGISYEEAIFEGYGPGGVAIMVHVMTDNRKRTVAELRHLMVKHGGSLGEPGCVAWMFDKRGLIEVEKRDVDEDSLIETVLEGGGDDFSEEEDAFEIISLPENHLSVSEHLEKEGFVVRSAEIAMIPKRTVRVEGDDVVKLLNLMDALSAHDDIQNLSSNFDIDDRALAEVE